MNWKPIPPPFREFKKEKCIDSAFLADFIYQIGESEDLRKPSKEVPLTQITSKAMKEKFAYLKNCLLTYRQKTGYGRGIAAVQVGISERFAVIGLNEDLLIIINPQITKVSEKKYRYSEMCMSAFPIIAPVIRPAWIECTYLDEQGKKKYWDTKDDTEFGKMLNRVMEHEIDHMEGIINIDQVKSKELILQSDPTFYDSVKFEKV